MSKSEELLQLIKDNPDLPVIPMVYYEVVGDGYGRWMGEWGRAEIRDFYLGQERIHFKDEDDEETVLADMVGCSHYETKDGRDITDLSENEWKSLYESIPWERAIIVNIDTL